MIRGSFATMAPWDVLDWLARRRLSGVFVAERSEVTRRFQVAGGVFTRVASSHPAELLGRLLVGAGYLGDEELANQLHKPGEPLGQALVAAGLVADEDLRAVLELKIRESAWEVLSWSDGHFTFEASGTGARRELQVAVPVRACLDDGESRVALWRAVRERIPDEETRFRVIHFEGTADELMQDVARGLTVREIMMERRSLPFNVYRALAELIERGLIAPANGPGAVPEPERGNRFASAARLLLSRPSVPHVSRSKEELAGEELSHNERSLLARIDGRWDLMTLIRTAPMGEGDALLTIEKLALRGLIAV